MAEHIEREKVYEMLNALGGCGAEPESWADGWDKAIDTAIDELNKIPAADVRPERHGRWKRLRCKRDRNDTFCCSECDYLLGYAPKYCPNCGAKMDGKDGKNG